MSRAAPAGYYDGYPIYVSHRAGKKYFALVHGKQVHFGAKKYQQYHDKIGVYSHLDHHDNTRRRSYKTRHNGDRHTPLTPGWFADRVLW